MFYILNLIKLINYSISFNYYVSFKNPSKQAVFVGFIFALVWKWGKNGADYKICAFLISSRLWTLCKT